MLTENISTLKIHKLTKEQYEREFNAGRTDKNALYLVPDEDADLSLYATVEDLNSKSDVGHKHNISDIANLQASLDGYVTEASVGSYISTHNTATNSHNDIRLLIEELTARLNVLADSDDATLDQMSEIVAYIKSNKTLIEEVTTNKVSVSDIIDNLTTNVADKPISAAQGVAIKALIDTLQTDLDTHTHELSISDVTNLKDSLDAKQPVITGGATTIISSNLAGNKVLISNSSGKVVVSDITSTELDLLGGVIAPVQTQLNNKSVVKFVRWG